MTVWRGKAWRLGSERVGWVEPDGGVFGGDRRFGPLIGTVGSDGWVWRGREWRGERLGFVDYADGLIWRGRQWSGEAVARVHPDGVVHLGRRWVGQQVGTVENVTTLRPAGGAALLLLFD